MGKSRQPTGIVYDDLFETHCNLYDEAHQETPKRYSAVMERCRELGLLDRCLRVSSVDASDEQILTNHSQELLDLMSETSGVTDLKKLQEMSDRFDSVYFHPDTKSVVRRAAGCAIKLVQEILAGVVHNGMAIVR